MIGVAIGTFGDYEFWAPMVERAVRSVQRQSFQCDYKWVHSNELHTARNAAADRLIEHGAEWLIFLDADDELEEDYAANMVMEAALCEDRWPIFAPAVRQVNDDVPEMSTHIHAVPTGQDLLRHNHFCIGAMHKAEMYQAIGGFDDWPVLEDWAYWLKAVTHGGQPRTAPHAVYRAHMDSERPGRNISVPSHVSSETATNIRAMYSFIMRRKEQLQQ